MTDCQLCASRSGRLDWSLACCRARFLADTHTLEARRGWLARWRAQGDTEIAEAVEAAARLLWGIRPRRLRP
jgi:hypothetical protein